MAAVFFVLFFFLFCFFSINVLNNSHFLFFNSWSSGNVQRQQVKSVLIHLCENVFETLV